MASRAVWSGFIQFSLVSVPVKAYTAAVSGGGGAPSLNQLHKECNSRIQYKKTCPIHGEVPNDQIVSGYQFADGQYVVIDPEEIQKLRPKAAKNISIAAFVKADAIDPSLFSGRSYYLLPDGPVAQRPYALLVRAMTEQKRQAFAQVVMSGRDKIMLVRPVGKLLMMSEITYASDMKPRSEFEGDVADVEVTANELKLAKTLTDALAEDDFDLTAYKDSYAEQLNKLIELKVEGKEVVAPPDEPAPQITNLMDALQKSLAEAKAKRTSGGGKPAKLVAPSTAGKPAAAAQGRKRKTS
jgi:DNA end-binding protein Ku